ncbi:MAG: hypothetical protein Q9198_010622, partial [Flavoplaca austrocitrina]
LLNLIPSTSTQHPKPSTPHSHLISPLHPFPALNPQDATDITTRFKSLKSDSKKKNNPDALIASIATETADSEDAPPSPTVEELLADLGPEEQWNIEKDEGNQIRELMEEARGVLASQPKDEHAGSVGVTEEDEGEGMDAGRQGKEHDEHKKKDDDDDDDEEEAALQLQRILDELEVEDTDPHSQPPSPQPQPPQHLTSPIPTITKTKNANNEQHTISFDLPSVPTTLPSAPKPTSTSLTNTKDPTTTWCTIGLANAVVRCQGCDDDLYCWGCWTEGHVGEAEGRGGR